MKQRDLEEFYQYAKEVVLDSGFTLEFAWASGLTEFKYSESDFLREMAWVILCSGFREAVVRARFSYISLCYCDWETASSIVENGQICVRAANYVFANSLKLTAIVSGARLILDHGFAHIKEAIDNDPLQQLQRFPYIGKTTAQHLAKNLGYPFAKNDRHLSRLAIRHKFEDAQTLCRRIAALSGDTIPVVDTVLWRFCTLKSVRPGQRLASAETI